MDSAPNPNTPMLTGLVVFEQYEVTAHLASEPRGESYLGVALEGGAEVVLRFMSHPVFAIAARSTWGAIGDRFERLCAIHHPHVERVITGGVVRRRTEDLLCVVTERIEGSSIAARLKGGQRVPLREALPLVRSVAEGLQAAHEAGVVHGDLRASNVILAQGRPSSPWPVLSDVGLNNLLAAALGADLSMRELAWAPESAAPEQIRGEPATVETDVYALGMLLYRMVTGTLPFACENASEVLIAQLSRPPIPMRDRGVERVTASLEAFVATCLAKAPRERFSSMAPLLAALDACEVELSARPSNPPRVSRPSAESPRADASEVSSPNGMRASATRLIVDARGRRSPLPAAPKDRPATMQSPRGPREAEAPANGASVAAPAALAAPSDSTVRMPALRPDAHDAMKMLRPLFLAVVALALLSGLLGGYMLAALGRPPVTTTTFAAHASTRAVRVRVRSNVREALITVRGRTYDNPMEAELIPGAAPEMIEVAARGFEPRRLWMPLNEHVDAQIDLVAPVAVAQPAAPVAQSPAEDPTPRRGRHRARPGSSTHRSGRGRHRAR